MLTSISLPVPQGGTPRLYTFHYTEGPTFWHLDSVLAPSVNGVSRRVLVRDSLGQWNLEHISRIVDPGGDSTIFHYEATTLRGRTDKNGHRTNFDFYWGMLQRTTLVMPNAADNIVHTFCAAEWIGYASCAPTAVRADSARTWMDGPRSVGDTTWFYLNRYGQPRKIVNALGDSTVIERTNGTFPILATAVIQPNGFRTEATYDFRGLDSIRREVNPYEDGGNPLTRFFWNSVDKPDSIIGPSGEETRFHYNANGDRDWQEDGRGALSRVQFSYNSNRQLEWIQPPGNDINHREHIEYDAQGNLGRLTSPLSLVTDYEADDIGRTSTIKNPADAGGRRRHQFFRYDLMDRVIAQRDSGPEVPYNIPDGPFGVTQVVVLSDSTVYDHEGNVLRDLRQSLPDTAHRGTAISQWTYDAANRKETHDESTGLTESWTYDPAGNPVTWTTRRSKVVQMGYDALNRLTSRITPPFQYDSVAGEQVPFDPNRPVWFPYFAPGFEYDPLASSIHRLHR